MTAEPPKKKVIVVVGPTASGKTAVAVEIAKALDGEIVSADSMQIYRHMDVGTAKPTKEEMGGIPIIFWILSSQMRSTPQACSKRMPFAP